MRGLLSVKGVPAKEGEVEQAAASFLGTGGGGWGADWLDSPVSEAIRPKITKSNLSKQEFV